MGFVQLMLAPIIAGIPTIGMTPLQFLVNPLLWAVALSRYDGVASAGPDFAYQLLFKALHHTERKAAGSLCAHKVSLPRHIA